MDGAEKRGVGSHQDDVPTPCPLNRLRKPRPALQPRSRLAYHTRYVSPFARLRLGRDFHSRFTGQGAAPSACHYFVVGGASFRERELTRFSEKMKSRAPVRASISRSAWTMASPRGRPDWRAERKENIRSFIWRTSR